MNIRLFLSAVLVTVLAVGTSYDASAHGRGCRGGRPRVVVRYCPPPPRYLAPPVAYYAARPYYARPHYYAGRYGGGRGYNHHGYNHCR